MSYESQVHSAQIKILRELLFLPSVTFAEAQKASGLESDHVKFHIKRLVEMGYVGKDENRYSLTVKGKEYANKLDTDAGTIERQPKVVVLLVIERDSDGVHEYLLQQRLKHPYYGFWGAPTGKVRWGESLLEAASRELKEETGLIGTFEHRGIYHERVKHTDTGEVIEDKIFHLMFSRDVNGEMIEEYEGGKNQWRTFEDMKHEPKKYKSFMQEMQACLDGVDLVESFCEYGNEEF